MWFKLNEDTKIAVRTSVGESKTEIIKNSMGQGSFGAALASSINIDCAIQDTLKNKKNSLHQSPERKCTSDARRHREGEHESGGSETRLY